jgi:hypothetical protein
MFQTVVTVYAVEVMPTCLRSYLTSYNNMCWVSRAHILMDNPTTNGSTMTGLGATHRLGSTARGHRHGKPVALPYPICNAVRYSLQPGHIYILSTFAPDGFGPSPS